MGQKNTYHYAFEAKRRQRRYILLSYLHASQIKKKEKGNVSFFLIRYETVLDRNTFKDQKTTNALYNIDLPPCISNKEKGNASFFLIRYETVLDRKTYTIMLVRPKDDKRAIYHWSTFMPFEKGKRKCFIFPYWLWNGISQKKKKKKKNIYQYDCKAKRRQTRYAPLIYRHAFRIREREK